MAPAEHGGMTASASTSGVTLDPSGARRLERQRINSGIHP
ncbi:hypothetical protein yberc0001_35580 [Yersinia bercovieri ATCC 43970]|uniref:Uncharacterized protein n=1 Tax=Yersinia bercovieri ATCC 43970 TaxID=349968 RepID=A0ABP2E130_YERBE|nr:hypothetical protein yberc0001_35580 [Yersinia bercovieri ATCC 43970]